MESTEMPVKKPGAWEQISNMSTDEIQKSMIEAVKKLDNDSQRELLETLRFMKIISPFFDDIEKIIKNNPKYDDMSLPEVIEADEKIKEIIKNAIEKQSKETGLKEIIFLNSTKVNNLLIPNTKVANQLTTGNLYNEITDVVVNGNPSKTKEVTTKVILNYEGVTLTGRREVTAYDRVVHNALISIKKAGNKNFTPAMVYRVMNGLTEREFVSPQAIEAVANSIDKLLVTRAKIDFTDEAKMYRKDIKNATLEGFLIEARRIEIKTRGGIVNGYEFISEKEPILYSHAQVSGQIYTIPIKLLQTKAKVNGTEEVIIIREYLIRQIEWIKSEKSTRSPNITYQGIYEELQITSLQGEAFKEKSKATRQNTKKILEAWKEQKYIKDYEEYKEGKTLKGITIAD